MTILNVNSDILTPPSLTLNTFGTMQPVIKAILFKKCSQQFLYGFPYEATISIHAGVQEFSSRRVDSRCICRYILYKFNFHGSRGGPSILPVVRMVSNFLQRGGGGIQVLNYSLSKAIKLVFFKGVWSPLWIQACNTWII